MIKCLWGSGPNLAQSSSDQLVGPGKASSRKGVITLCGNREVLGTTSRQSMDRNLWTYDPGIHMTVHLCGCGDHQCSLSWRSGILENRTHSINIYSWQKETVYFVLHKFFLHCVYITQRKLLRLVNKMGINNIYRLLTVEEESGWRIYTYVAWGYLILMILYHVCTLFLDGFARFKTCLSTVLIKVKKIAM